jgi:tetratricopeptide (TPR) repeat protein
MIRVDSGERQTREAETGLFPRIVLTGVLILLPLHGQEIYQHAKAAFEEGRYADAVSLLDNVPGVEAQRPAMYNLRALALAELGRYDAALTANERARELDRANPNYVYNAGLIYIAKRDSAQAEAFFRRSLQDFPRSAQLYEGLGEALFQLNRFSEVEQCLQRAAEMAPSSSSIWIAMARLYYALGDGRKLEAAASRAIALDRMNYRACYYYGTWLLEYQGQAETGAEYIRRSIELQPRFVDGLKAWGRIASHEGRWNEAVRTYERAVAVDSSDRQLFYLLSVAYRKLGQEQKAEGALAEYRKLASP